MKNIETILKEAGIEIPADKKEAIDKAVAENYKTVADYDKQKDKLTTAESKVKENEKTMKELQTQLDGLKDVDVSAMKKQIEDLTAQNKQKDDDYAAKIADRDLSDLINGAISSANGKNTKAIKALLDMDKIKESKNQKEDVVAAIKALTEAEDSKMLFGEATPNPTGSGNPIGSFGSGNNGNTETAQMRSIMGLPPVTKGE